MKPREKFLQLWKANDGPELEPEYKFHPKRRWKADFRCESPHGPVQIEIEGGIWLGRFARHTNPQGYWRDCEKYNEACLMGIKVVRLAGPLINHDYVGRLAGWLRGRGESPDLGMDAPPVRKKQSAKGGNRRASR